MTKKTTKKKPSPAKATVPAPPPATLQIQVQDPTQMLERVRAQDDAAADIGTLGEIAAVGQLGMVEIKLRPEEEAELAKGVNMDDVLVKPQGIPYLPHGKYTAWFNRAFGRFGWAIVPKAKPIKAESAGGALVVVPYVLYVHGQPAAFALGEQEFNDKNRDQTWGDAVEATVASGLRRCAKRIGVGLELWDKDFLAEFLESKCIQVQTDRGRQWRRILDRPLRGETQATRHRRVEEKPLPPMQAPTWESPMQEELDHFHAQAEAIAAQPPTQDPEPAGDYITIPQRRRMAVIASRRGRDENEVRLWLRKKWGVKTSKEIRRAQYDAVCAELEASGPLTIPGDGE